MSTVRVTAGGFTKVVKVPEPEGGKIIARAAAPARVLANGIVERVVINNSDNGNDGNSSLHVFPTYAAINLSGKGPGIVKVAADEMNNNGLKGFYIYDGEDLTPIITG